MGEPDHTVLRLESFAVRTNGGEVRVTLSTEDGDRRDLVIANDHLGQLIDSLMRVHLDAEVAKAAPPKEWEVDEEYRPPALTLHVTDVDVVKWATGGAALRMRTVEGHNVLAAFMPEKLRFLRETLRQHFDGPGRPMHPDGDPPPIGPAVLPGQAPLQNEFYLQDGSGTPIDPMEAVFPLLKQMKKDVLQFVGTGFFISDNGLFASARHVLEELNDDELPQASTLVGLHLLEGGHVLFRPVVNYATHPVADVGVGKLADAHDPDGNQVKCKQLVLTSAEPALGDWVFTYAYPHTGQEQDHMLFSPRYYSGKLVERHPQGRDKAGLPGPCWRTSMVISGGASGGPVFGRDGRVFGINSRGIEETAVSWVSRVEELLDVEIGQVTLPGSPEPRKLTIGELAQMNYIHIL